MERDVEQADIVVVEAAVHDERYYHDEVAPGDRSDTAARDGFGVRSTPGAKRLGLRVVL